MVTSSAGRSSRASPPNFQISDGHVTCAGQLRNYTVVMDCNHGLKGIVSFKKDTESAFSGGTLRLSDGTAGTFILGDDAAKLCARTVALAAT